MPMCLAISCRLLLSHMIRQCISSIFSPVVASLGRLDHLLSSPLPPLLISTAHFFHLAVRRRLIPKGFNEVVMNVLKLMPMCLAISRRLLLSHMIRQCISSIFSSIVASLGRPDHLLSSPLPPLLISTAHFFHLPVRRRLIPKGFNEVVMNVLKLMPMCLAISRRLLLSHMIRQCISSIFSSVVASLGRPDHL